MFSLARLTLIACLFLMCATAVCAQGDMYRPPNKKAGSQRRPPAAVATALTNDSILSLVRGELSDEVIIRKMRATQCRFDVSPEAIADLKQQGVSKLVLEEMINLSTPPPAIPAAPTGLVADRS